MKKLPKQQQKDNGSSKAKLQEKRAKGRIVFILRVGLSNIRLRFKIESTVVLLQPPPVSFFFYQWGIWKNKADALPKQFPQGPCVVCACIWGKFVLRREGGREGGGVSAWRLISLPLPLSLLSGYALCCAALLNGSLMTTSGVTSEAGRGIIHF